MTHWTIFFMVTTGLFFIGMILALSFYRTVDKMLDEALDTLKTYEKIVNTQQETFKIQEENYNTLTSMNDQLLEMLEGYVDKKLLSFVNVDDTTPNNKKN